MIKRDALIKTIDQIIGQDLFDESRDKDPYANGVQIRGKEDVKKVAIGVSPSLDFFQEAISVNADFCIFHHGLDLTGNNIIQSRIHPGQQKRLELVFKNQLTVAGYHYTLDIHPKIGNNATIIKKLGAKRLEEKYLGWGWVGEFAKPKDVEEIAKMCTAIFDHDVFAVYAGPKKVKRIGVCSGAAKPYGTDIWEIIDKGIELHISGEIVEPGPAFAKDLGFNYFSCGHYATEVFGVQELGKELKNKYKDKLAVEFIDIPNPL